MYVGTAVDIFFLMDCGTCILGQFICMGGSVVGKYISMGSCPLGKPKPCSLSVLHFKNRPSIEGNTFSLNKYC